jgi:chemotaxis signal transduction protein
MSLERPLHRAQRLALVFRGAGTLWALPASAVLEVAQAPAALPAERNGVPVEEFAALLGEPRPRDPRAVTLVLDSAPPRALLVDGVAEVADLATAPFFRLPPAIERPARGLLRGAVLHGSRLILELVPKALAEAQAGQLSRPAPPFLVAPEAAGEPPGKALIFEVGGGALYGVCLPLVTGALRIGRPCRVPLAPYGHAGLIHHERSLLPIYDLSRIAGGPPTGGELAVVLDIAGTALGAAAHQVLGVVAEFCRDGSPEKGGVRWTTRDGRPVFFPELERWFPPLA